ncbi:MAG: insulinase family protein [Oscillospiraceae bacterium]|nr:insulinase family protein [Oscillospiraceae bacterium]
MSEIRNNILNESYQLIETDSGLKIAVYNMPGYNAVHAVFATNFGSVDRSFVMNGERFDIPAGVAHFLEHKMFENEDGDAFEKYAKTGANANAFTGFDKTCYIFTATENVDESLDILLNFVTTPYFTPQTVEKEQGIIGQEIKMYDDSANWRLLFGVLEGLFINHTIRDDIAGTVESISYITDKMLYDCAKAFYSPSQMFLSVAGNITADRVLAACERAGFKYEKLEVERLKTEEPDEINYTEKSITMPVSVPMVAVGFKEKMSCPVSLKEEIAGEIIMDILTGPTSRLFTQLYDENIVNGTFEGEILSGDDYYATIISGETRQPDILIGEITAAIDQLKESGISEDDFITSKNAMYGSMVMDFESVEEVATNAATAHFKGRTAYTALEELSELTLEYVNSQLKNMFRADKKTVFTVMPMEADND